MGETLAPRPCMGLLVIEHSVLPTLSQALVPPHLSTQACTFSPGQDFPNCGPSLILPKHCPLLIPPCPTPDLSHLPESPPTKFPSLHFPHAWSSPQLGFNVPNGSDPQPQAPSPQSLQALLGDLLDAQKVLQDVDVLSALALLLPQGACAGRASAPQASSLNGLANSTGISANAGSNTTVEEDTQSPVTPASPDTLQGQCSAFVQLWAGLQPILCGNNR